MQQHPHLAVLYHKYIGETQPFRKVHRMIDWFESLIKTHTVVILAEYVRLNQLSDQAKALLAYKLHLPTLGVWKEISQTLFKELDKSNLVWTQPDFPREFKKLMKDLGKYDVIELRNFYAHGATPEDEQCKKHILEFESFLLRLTQLKWLKQSSMIVKEGKVYLIVSERELSLHPVLLFRKENSESSLAFFNDLKYDKVGLLNYPLSKYYREEEFYGEFQKFLPLDEWKRSNREKFAQQIDELTESFKGRKEELAKLMGFVQSKRKGYFSILGHPGIGKSTLIAQFVKELREQPDLAHLKVIEYFIKRGNSSARPETFLNYLIQKTDEVFKEGKNIRADKNEPWSLQEALFEKWREWSSNNQGIKLLFLIDGLDEGTDTDLLSYLPRENFDNILFIYGSRPGGQQSVKDFFHTLPLEHHIRHELGGLKKEDIRSLIYEVGNKYELERESAWIDEVLNRSKGYPLYIKLLCVAIVNGSIALNDVDTLPKGIYEQYNRILDRYAKDIHFGNATLQCLYSLAAAKDYLNIHQLGRINHLDEISKAQVSGILMEILTKKENPKDPPSFQLFHESFREYLLKEKKEEVEEAQERIIEFCSKWEELEGSASQHYTLQHYAPHLKESSKSKRKQELLQLLNKKAYIKTQKQVLRQFISTKNLLQLGLEEACKQKNWEVQLETALSLVDLKYEEANDVDSIIEMVAHGEIELALQRIESFGGEDEEGFKRKFILYMLCLRELTLLGSKEKCSKKAAIEEIIDHLDHNIPADTSWIDWGTFFPSYLVFSIAGELDAMGMEFLSIYKRTREWGKEWLQENGPYNEIQINILRKIINTTFEPIRKSLYPIELIKELMLILNECEKADFKDISGDLANQIINLLESYKNQILKSGTPLPDLIQLGLAIFDLGFQKEIKPYLNSLIDHIPKIHNNSKKLSYLVEIGLNYHERKDFVIASRLMDEALFILPKTKSPEISILAKLSTYLLDIDHDKSKKLIKQCTDKLKSSFKYQDYLFNYEIIALELSKQKKITQAFDLISNLDKEAENSILLKILKQLCVEGDFLEASSIIDKLNENEHDKDEAFELLSIYYAKVGNFQSAFSILKNIKNPVSRCRASLQSFKISLIKGNQKLTENIFVNTLSEYKKIKNNHFHKELLGLELSNLIFKQNEISEAYYFVKEHIKTILNSKMDLFDNEVIHDFSWKLSKIGKINEAIILAQSFDGEDFEVIVSDICRLLLQQGKITIALEKSELLTNEYYKQNLLLEISLKLSENGQPAEALKITNLLNLTDRSIALAHISNGFETKSDKSIAKNILKKSIENVQLIQNEQNKIRALNSLFLTLLDLNKINEAKKILDLTKNQINNHLKGEFRDKALEETSLMLITNKFPKEAFELCSEIKKKSLQKDTFFHLFKEILKHYNNTIIVEILDELISGDVSKKRLNEIFLASFQMQELDITNKSLLKSIPANKEAFISSFYEFVPPEKKINFAKKIIYQTKLSPNRFYFDLIIEYIKTGKWQLAEKIIIDISKPFLISNILEFCKNEHGWIKSLAFSSKIKSLELKKYFLSDWTEGISASETDEFILEEALPYFIFDTDSLEILLQKYALHEIFLGNSSQEQLKRLNQTLNIQWALDIAATFPKDEENTDLTIN